MKPKCRLGHPMHFVGKRNQCATCNKRRVAEWTLKNPERAAEILAKYRGGPKWKALQAARDKAWRQKHDPLIEKRDVEGYQNQWKRG